MCIGVTNFSLSSIGQFNDLLLFHKLYVSAGYTDPRRNSWSVGSWMHETACVDTQFDSESMTIGLAVLQSNIT